MKKANAFIFICFYLLATKVVFASTVQIDGKNYECKYTSYEAHTCLIDKKVVIVSKTDNDIFVAISRDKTGTLSLKGVQKVVNGKTTEYQIAGDAPVYEDSLTSRMTAADLVLKTFEHRGDEPDFKDLVAAAKNIRAYEREPKPKVKVAIKETGNSYECTAGVTRPYTPAEVRMQERYKAKFVCPFYSCKGSNPDEKVLMLLPKAGSAFSTPSVTILNFGAARYIYENFKVTDSSYVPYLAVTKKPVIKPDSDLPAEDLDPNLLVPSNISRDRTGYEYLMGIATKKDTGTLELMDLCKGDKNLEPLFAEQQKVADKIYGMLANAEVIEYLKLIDNKIISYYVDKTKGMGLGCLYQDKIVDRSVMGKFEHLKEISTIKPATKVLKPEEVQELFKKAKNMKDIPFGYKYDGCYARAHIMARRFEEMGVPTQKVWIKGKLSVPNTDIEWDYHVAPSVQVKEKNGKIVNYVIDPSLTDKAVPLDDWIASMSSKAKGGVLKTTYPFPNNGMDFERTAVAISNSDNYGPVDLGGMMTEEDKMELSKRRLKQFSEALGSAQ